jgi:RimJ/RimL family protein N-acetyltransferase
MTPEYEIRPLEASDFPAFLDIQKHALLNAPEVFGSDYDWFDALSILGKEQRYERYILFPYQYLLGAILEDGTIVGMVGFSCDHTRTKVRHKGRIWGMYVIPTHRGRGIASTLVQSALATAEEIGVEQIQLSVSTDNRDSYGLYLRLGFSAYGLESHAMKVGEQFVDEYLMVKFLN